MPRNQTPITKKILNLLFRAFPPSTRATQDVALAQGVGLLRAEFIPPKAGLRFGAPPTFDKTRWTVLPDRVRCVDVVGVRTSAFGTTLRIPNAKNCEPWFRRKSSGAAAAMSPSTLARLIEPSKSYLAKVGFPRLL